MRSGSLILAATALVTPSLGFPCGFQLAKTVSGYTRIGDLLVNAPDVHHQTIYQVLKGREEFSTLVKYIDEMAEIRELLDSDMQMTFFSPTNEAMIHVHVYNWECGNEEECLKLMTDTAKYHIVPQVIEGRDFGQNSTVSTVLRADDGSFHGANWRIKITPSPLPPWKTMLNAIVTITEYDIHAKNGVIHAVDSPVLLPPDIMDSIYPYPEDHSISMMALLKTNLQGNLEFNSGYYNKRLDLPRHETHHNDRHGLGSPMSTIFMPINEAWNKLPSDLMRYLFSPAGERTLRKLLAWHILPNAAVFSEWGIPCLHHMTNITIDSDDLGFTWGHRFDTLIDQQMPVYVKKSKLKLPGSQAYEVAMKAHGVSVIPVHVDYPAQSGAGHGLSQVLSPRSQHWIDDETNAKDWEDWKDWLMEWSVEHNEHDSV